MPSSAVVVTHDVVSTVDDANVPPPELDMVRVYVPGRQWLFWGRGVISVMGQLMLGERGL